MDRKLLNGFSTLFSLEFVARFSFWAIQSILVIYLVQQLRIPQTRAYDIFSTYASMTWACTILAGLLADYVFGFRQLLVIGVVFSFTGSLLLLMQDNVFYLGLSCLTLGMGLIIPNVANMVGCLYQPEDPTRDRGFTIFYMATNLGGLLGPILVGLIAKRYGWTCGIALGAAFLGLWFVMYLITRRFLLDRGSPPNTRWVRYRGLVLMALLALVAGLFYFLKQDDSVGPLLYLIGGLALAYLFVLAWRHPAHERRHILTLLLMIFYTLLYFALVFQTLTSFVIYMDQHVDLNVLGFNIPANVFVSMEPLFIVLLAPPVSQALKSLQKTGLTPSNGSKLLIGMSLAAVSFLVFYHSAAVATLTLQKSPLYWMVIGTLLLAAGELFIMPPLLSSITKLSPKDVKGTMMGFLYLAIAFSGYLAGQIAKLTASIQAPAHSAAAYMAVYRSIALITLGVVAISAVFFWVGRLIKRADPAD